jgi:hypothetical protein
MVAKLRSTLKQHSGRVPFRLTEDEQQIALLDHVRTRGCPTLVCIHVPNGGLRTKAEAAIFKAMGVEAGTPDLFFFWKNKTFALELKSDDRKKPSGSQEHMHMRLRNAGVEVRTAWSLDQAIVICEEWGFFRGVADISRPQP